jgi:hypothetical protein
MNKNQIHVFANDEFGEIRTVEINGEVWFVGKDVAAILGYEATRNALKNQVDTEDKLTHRISASGQSRSVIIINESGFDIKELRELMEYDEMDLESLGQKKTALFVIISDTDDTFNFIVAIMYTQLFNLLLMYYKHSLLLSEQGLQFGA